MNNTKPTDKLCDGEPGYGTLKCSNLGGGCPGAANSNCYPLDVWTMSKTSETTYSDFYFGNGALHPVDRGVTYAFTVRCVPDLPTAKCRVTGGCPGSADNNCWPNHIWIAGGSQYNLSGGTFGATGGSTTHAFSVRCVLGLKFANIFCKKITDYFPCSVSSWLAAARAPTTATATRT